MYTYMTLVAQGLISTGMILVYYPSECGDSI